MIDSRFIIRYTNGLYTTDAADAPTYQEFRDMFSSGQIVSKEWAIKELQKLNIILDQSVVLVGAWYGTLGVLLRKQFPLIGKMTLLDIDPRCKKFLDNIIYDAEDTRAVTGDMFNYDYKEDLVINTACEHIPDIRAWLSKIKKGTIVLLQSNNAFEYPDHVNCVNTMEEFKNQTELEEILYIGELKTPMYTRFMIIGKT